MDGFNQMSCDRNDKELSMIFTDALIQGNLEAVRKYPSQINPIRNAKGCFKCRGNWALH